MCKATKDNPICHTLFQPDKTSSLKTRIAKIFIVFHRLIASSPHRKKGRSPPATPFPNPQSLQGFHV